MSYIPPPPPPWNSPHAAAPGYGYMPPPPPLYTGRPGVWPWFVVYVICMALLYLAVAGLGTLILVAPEQMLSEKDDPAEMKVIGIICTIMGFGLAIPFGIAPFLPRRPWVWVYDIVLICFSVLMSVCLLPAMIPLLIFWLKPETRSWFGRSA